MTPRYATADCDWPLICPSAAWGSVCSACGNKCYKSFTLNALLLGRLPRTFARVMTGRKPTSRTATAGVFPLRHRAQTTIFGLLQLSAQNVLFFTANFHSDFRPPISDI
jgi:hypothetical protein